MQILINDNSYIFSENILSRQDTRESYFKLANTVFGLKFDDWYQSGYWDNKFIPYVLYDGSVAVASVGVCINDVIWQDTSKCYVQFSTVMTLPEYRKKGLNRWLMEYVLNVWKDKCDAIYLLSNDSVVDFYPKFGFEEFTEYDFTLPVKRMKGKYRKLNVNNADDLNLIAKKYELSNPFSELRVNNLSQFMFHCLYFRSNDIYYIEQYDAVAILKNSGNKIICYDMLTDFGGQLDEILGALAGEEVEFAYLGFTPTAIEKCSIVKSQEEDNHLFVLTGKENIFKDNKVMFPLLSRA